MLELTGFSNRRGGLNVNQATAFSFSALDRARLPAQLRHADLRRIRRLSRRDRLGLAILGALSGWAHRRAPLPTSPPASFGSRPLSTGEGGRTTMAGEAAVIPRATWLIVALVGLALAYGLYNPLYWLLATLPGFNLFRVPARWLALFALGTAGLAGLGVEALIKRSPLTPAPSPTQAGRGESATARSRLAPLPEFGEGQEVGSRLNQPSADAADHPIVDAGLAALSLLTLRQIAGAPIKPYQRRSR